MKQRKLTTKQLEKFTWLLRLMIEGGLPLCESLDVLAEEFTGAFSKIIAKMNKEIKDGCSLVNAMQNSNVFSEFYVEMIRAGVDRGILDTVLYRLENILPMKQPLNDLTLFSLIFGNMLSAGISMLNALDILKKMFSNNKKFAKAIGGVRKRVSEGGYVFEGIQQYAVFPRLFWQLVQMGEKVGALDQILLKYAEAVMKHEE